MCLSAAAFSENDHGTHKFGFENRARAINNAVQGRRHPADHRVADPMLDVSDRLPGGSLVPLPVQLFCRETELDGQVAG